MDVASVSNWVEGARLRTPPTAAALVIVGSAGAHCLGGLSMAHAVLALLVMLVLQVGANYANNYLDGTRSTGDNHREPACLMGGDLTKLKMVLAAVLGSFAVTGAAGPTLVAVSGTWWLITTDVTAVVAVWFYTDDGHPYVCLGISLPELMVLAFSGLLACMDAAWTQVRPAPWWLWMNASTVDLFLVALPIVSNIRDIPTDRESGKMTATVHLDDRPSRWVFVACVWLPVAMITMLGIAVGLYPLATGVLSVREGA